MSDNELSGPQKREIALRYWLQGHGYYGTLEALEVVKSLHTGTRKDGLTPEVDHQISVALLVRTLPVLLHPEATLTTILFHDTIEDTSFSQDDVRAGWGDQVAHSTLLMSKKVNGVRRVTDDVYFAELATDPIASLGKGADRGHNQFTMVGVFTLAKMIDYADEAETRILPMLKAARRRFPQQEPSYQNLKFLLLNQIQMVRALAAPAAA